MQGGGVSEMVSSVSGTLYLLMETHRGAALAT